MGCYSQGFYLALDAENQNSTKENAMEKGLLERQTEALEMISTTLGLILRRYNGEAGPPTPAPTATTKPKAKAEAKAEAKAAKAATKTADEPVVDELDISLDAAPAAPVKEVTVQDCRDALETYNNLNGLEEAKNILREFQVPKVSVIPEEKRQAFVDRCLGNS